MRKFNYDDESDESRREVDNFLQDDVRIQDENDIIESQIDFVKVDFNYRVLRAAIKFCENTFLWKFIPIETRLSMLEKAYSKLKELKDR